MTAPKFRERRKNLLSCVFPLHKISHNSVSSICCARTLKKCAKSVRHVEIVALSTKTIPFLAFLFPLSFHDLVFSRAPFSLALLLLIAVSGLICCLWMENYGDIGGDVKISLLQGIQVVRNGQLNCLALSHLI